MHVRLVCVLTAFGRCIATAIARVRCSLKLDCLFQAFLSGKLKVTGNVMIAQSIGQILADKSSL